MPKASPLLSSFSAGELSPLLEGRSDFDKYKTGGPLMENYVVTVQGPARMRLGTQYAGTANTTGDAAFLVPFEANTDAAFVLELGAGYMKFWYQRKRIVVQPATGLWHPDDGSGDPVAQLATPWNLADLTGEDGILNVQFAQSNDVMWLVHPLRFPWKLTRIAQYQFSGVQMGDQINAPSPFNDQNIKKTLTVYSSDVTGVVTLTASGVVFTADMVQTCFYLEQPAADSIKPWQVAIPYVVGDTVRSDGNNYSALNAATSGNVKPTHTSGAKFDGKTGVQWNWTDQGFGIVLITSVAADGKSAQGTVIVDLPRTLKGAATPSFRWAKQAWNTTDGFPIAVQFFRGRLCFGRGQTFWASVVGDFENFATTDGGVVTDDMAIIATIGAERNDRIRWFSCLGPLIVGTASGESSIQELSLSNPFSSSNIQVTPQSGYGSRKIQPHRIQEAIIYVQRGGRRLRECMFDWSTQGYRSNDLAALSQETVVGSRAITGQSGIIAMAYQKEPDQILWCVRGDGQLLGFTYAKEHNVFAWHRHKIGGIYAGTTGATLDYGIVRSVACIPAADNSTEDVYLTVTRTVAGQPTTYVEVMGSHTSWASNNVFYYHDIPDATEAFYLDAYIRGVVESSGFLGCPQLTGNSVAGVVAGMYVPPQTITAQGTFQPPAGNVGKNMVVGCPYNATLQTMRVDAGAADGTSQGKLSKIQSVTVRLKSSLNLLYGPDVNTLTREEFRKQNSQFDNPVALFTGDRVLTWQGDWEEGSRITIRQDQPFPSNIIALMPRMHVEDER
jgi:hypothetical protein